MINMNKLCLILVLYWTCLSNGTRVALYKIDDRYGLASQNDECETNCTCINKSMTCQEIPGNVPGKIRFVTVMNHVGWLENAFKGQGWEHVETLHISGTTSKIRNGDLNGLTSVSELSMTFPTMGPIATNVFVDTPLIEKLFLLKMNEVGTSELFDALSKSDVLNTLTELYFEPDAVENPPLIELTNKIVNSLALKPLSHLHISKTILHLTVEASLKLVLMLDVLNVSYSQLSLINLPLKLPANYSDDVPLLDSLDVSGTTTPWSQTVSLTNQSISSSNIGFRIKNIYVNRHFLSDCNLVFYNSTFNAKVFLRTLTAQHNKIRAIYGQMIASNSLEILDLSQNKIEYISPDFTSSVVHLKTLVLSHNRLYEMQMMPEFTELIAPLQNLSILFIDDNNISHIPWNMFHHNEQLETLNLAGNKLTTVGFDLRSLKVLKTLDLTRNAIHFMEGGNLQNLAAFVTERKKHTPFQILMQDNPFQCCCKSVRFIQWLYTIENEDVSQYYVCVYEGSSINIDTTAIKKSRFLCKRTLIIITSSILSISLICIVCGSFYGARRCRRRHSANERTTKFKQDFINGLLPHDYICFMAIAGHDEDVVQKYLLTPLTSILKEKLNTNKDVLATGYNFKPGFPIHEEAFEFVKRSCVFVAVVSDAFCESEYCTGEIREACTQQKPIIVVLLGTVAEDKMSPYLQEVFRRKARAKITRCENGDISLVPDIETLTECVLTLAINGNEV